MSQLTRRRIQAEQSVKAFEKRGKRRILRALLCNTAGVFDVTGRDGFLYARLMRETGTQLVEVRNAISIQRIADLPILVEETSTGYVLLGIDTSDYFANPLANTVGSHADQHIIGEAATGGFDPLPIYNAALVNLHTRAQVTPNMTVHVEEGAHMTGGTWQYFAGANTAALVAPAGAGDARYDLVYVGSDNALHVVTGVEVTSPTVPTKPTVPASATPVGWILLSNGDTSITQSMIYEPRVTAMATLNATPATHNILSASHGDTTAAAAVRGDIISAQGASPTWSRLAHPGTANRFLVTDATDVAWSVGAFNATTTNTQLLFSNSKTYYQLNFTRSGVNFSQIAVKEGESANFTGSLTVNASSIVFGGFTLTSAATGTLPVGTGVINNVAIWTGTNTLSTVGGVIQPNRVITANVGGTPVWSTFYIDIQSNSAINGSLVGNMTGGGTVATGGFTLTIPATGTAALATGISGGQTIYGGTGANDDLILEGTSHATKTTSYVILQPTGGNVGIGTTTPAALLQVNSPSGVDASLNIFRGANTDQAYIGIIPAGAFTPTNVAWSFGMLANSNTFNIQAYNGTATNPYLSVSNAGYVSIGVAPVANQFLTIQSATATNTALVLKTSDNDATKNLLEVLSSTGTQFIRVQPTGRMDISNIGVHLAGAESQLGLVQYGNTAGDILYLNRAITGAASGTYRGINVLIAGSDTGTNDLIVGCRFQANVGGGTTGTLQGFSSEMTVVLASTVTTLVGVGASFAFSAALTSTNSIAFSANIATSAAGGGITNLIGYDCSATSGSATVTNAYGLRIGDITIGGTLNRAISTGKGLVVLGDKTTITGWQDVQQLIVTGHTTQAVATPMAQFTRNDAAAGISAMLGLTALGSGANGDGGSVVMNGKTSTTAAQAMGLEQWLWVDATHATRKARITYSVYDTAVREFLRGEAFGSEPGIGLLGGLAAASTIGILGQTAKTISMNRHVTANTAGNNLTVQAGGATSGATDKDGGRLYLLPGLSTGTAKSSVRIQRTTRAASTGTSDNTLVDAHIIPSVARASAEGAINLFEVAMPDNSAIGGLVTFQILATDGTDFQAHSGHANYAATNKAGVYNMQIQDEPAGDDANAASSGALSDTWAITSGTNKVTISVTVACTTIVANDIQVFYTIHNGSAQAVTQL